MDKEIFDNIITNKSRSNDNKNIGLLIVSVAFLATGGIFVRSSSLPPINIGLYRMIIAFPFLLLMGFKGLKDVNKVDFVFSLLSGIFMSLDLVFYNISIVNTSLANTNLLNNMTAFIIIPVSYFLFKEKIPKFYFVSLLMTLFGVVVLVLGKNEKATSNYVGDLCALAAAVFYGLYILTTYKLREKISSSTILSISAIGAIISLFVISYFTEGIKVPSSKKEIFDLLLLAIFMQVIGQNLLAYCQGKISVNLSIAITLLQPVFAAIYSFILFNERISIIEIIGMLIVIVGVYICKRQYS